MAPVNIAWQLFCRKSVGAEDSTAATGAGEATKESGRGGTDLGWGSKGGRPPSIWLFPNTASMKATGKNILFMYEGNMYVVDGFKSVYYATENANSFSIFIRMH